MSEITDDHQSYIAEDQAADEFIDASDPFATAFGRQPRKDAVTDGIVRGTHFDWIPDLEDK